MNKEKSINKGTTLEDSIEALKIIDKKRKE